MSDNNTEYYDPDFIGELIEIELSEGDNSFLIKALDEYPEKIAKSAAVAHAAQGNNTEALQILIGRGFSIGPVRPHYEDFGSDGDDLWYSPIGEAAENLAFEALEILVAAGADVNETVEGENWPWPPLMRAIISAKNNNLNLSCKMITRLIELGADVNAVVVWPADKKSYTPLSFVRECIAQKKVREKLAALLEERGAKLHDRPIRPKFRDGVPQESWVRGKLSFNCAEAGALETLEIFGREYRFRWIPSGTFTMGSPKEEAYREANEKERSVTIDEGFWMLETPVTQAAYWEIMDENPSTYKAVEPNGDGLSQYERPVESVTWYDAKAFCAELNALAKGSGAFFRLPTEVEWEYACRAGTSTPFSFGTAHNGTLDNIDGTAPYGTEDEGPNVGVTTPVRSYPPNPWGLYDLHGNVAEWCEDKYRQAAPSMARPKQIDVDYRVMNRDPDPSVERSVRGGSFNSDGRGARSALRGSCAAIDCLDSIGFRVVAVARE